MTHKHQSNCYRTINGIRYINYADLIYQEKENQKVLMAARARFTSVRKVKHPDGYYQVFVPDTQFNG